MPALKLRLKRKGGGGEKKMHCAPHLLSAALCHGASFLSFLLHEHQQPELPNEMAWREFAACNHCNPGQSLVICPRWAAPTGCC